MTAPVSITADPQWFRAVLTVPAASAAPQWLDELAAAFAEDPERIGDLLLDLHSLNERVAADVVRGDEYSAEHASGHADQVRGVLAEDLAVDVSVQLDEDAARALSEAALAAARHTFSARNRAGVDADRQVAPLGRAA